MRPQVVQLLWERQPVKAVKLVREATGLGLKEAKDITDAIALEERIDPRGRRR
ncbi:MAG TPA: ribosomal protein L7/L12 [Iamia sp.]